MSVARSAFQFNLFWFSRHTLFYDFFFLAGFYFFAHKSSGFCLCPFHLLVYVCCLRVFLILLNVIAPACGGAQIPLHYGNSLCWVWVLWSNFILNFTTKYPTTASVPDGVSSFMPFPIFPFHWYNLCLTNQTNQARILSHILHFLFRSSFSHIFQKA